jgi:Ribbon-helix-helix protein, copG family
MDRDGRRAVVSVRISEADRERLRQIADARGTSVSDLVRSAVLREAGGEPRVTTSTMVSGGKSHEIGKGLTWDTMTGTRIDGNTLTC